MQERSGEGGRGCPEQGVDGVERSQPALGPGQGVPEPVYTPVKRLLKVIACPTLLPSFSAPSLSQVVLRGPWDLL